MAEDSTMVAAEGSPGKLLRETRERHGIALDEASRVTRIGQNYLTALEEDRFERLPNPAYVRGFLRNYAAFLGLSADSVLSPYDRMIASPAATEPPRQKARPGAKTGTKEPLQRWKVFIVFPILLMAALAVYFLTGRWGEPPVASRPPAPAAVPAAVPAPVPQPVPVAAAPSTQQAAAPTPAVAKAPLPAVAGVLRLKVNEETHLVMNIDETLAQEYQLRPGDVIEWKGEKSFSLELSNAGGVEADLGGKRLRPFGGRGAPARVVVRTDGRIE